jgi:hypothetical protein
VPFKLVVETISFEDARNIKNGKPPLYKDEVDNASLEKESYILPQSYFGTEWRKTKREIT